MKRNHALALGMLLTAASGATATSLTACGGATAPLEAGDAAAKEAAAYVSCAFTAEPAKPPCTQYIGLRGNLAACGIPDGAAAGALPSATCLANCQSSSCSLVLDAAVAPGIAGPGYPGIACGCR